MMDRRAFIGAVGGSIVARSFVADAQQPSKVCQIGYLNYGTPAESANRVSALRAGLREHGYVEGKNINIVFRWAETVERLRALADDLVRLKGDLIFAPSSTEVRGRPAGHQHHTDRVRQPCRSGSRRTRHEPGAARRQCHWAFRSDDRDRGQTTRDPEGGTAGQEADRRPGGFNDTLHPPRLARDPGHGPRTRGATSNGASSDSRGSR